VLASLQVMTLQGQLVVSCIIAIYNLGLEDVGFSV
jgi:hypothetical protein